MPPVLRTVGYEGTTVARFLDALRDTGVELLVDVRAVASSRRPGFAKTALAANLDAIGIPYLHLRGLGTPADGRAAARSGDHAGMRRIFAAHMATERAIDELDRLVALVESGRKVALLCFEADPAHCHRAIVADAVAGRTGARVEHLRPERDDD